MLATVYGIVGQHKGWLEVQSEVGRGTRFRVFLPEAAPTSACDPKPTKTPSLAGYRGHETVLLVEDEARDGNESPKETAESPESGFFPCKGVAPEAGQH
jgi:hypothetical protein